MKKRTKKRTTASEWAERIADWEASGQTAREYVKRIKLPGQRVSWWNMQLRRRHRVATVEVLPKPGGRGRAQPDLSPVRVVEYGAGAFWSDRLVEVGGRDNLSLSHRLSTAS